MAYTLHPDQKETKNVASIMKLDLSHSKISHKHMDSFQ